MNDAHITLENGNIIIDVELIQDLKAIECATPVHLGEPFYIEQTLGELILNFYDKNKK